MALSIPAFARTDLRVPGWLRQLPWSGRIGLVTLVVLVLAAALGPVFTLDPYAQDLSRALQGPSTEHWLGTDQLGRDLFARIVLGAQLSLTIGFSATLFGLVVGGVIGAIAGYFGGWFDALVMRVMDMLIVFPGILVAMIVITVVGPGLVNIILAVGLRALPVFARVVQTSTIALRERDYIVAARAAGGSGMWILWAHIRPALVNSLVVLAALEVANSILVAATLSFLGIGISPETPEWGAMLNSGREYIFQQGQLVIFPGLAIMITVLGVNLFADGMRTVLDPRRSRGTLL
jgi:ABC-type dipeptide/oligopeptide/nickel transport system permease subunit